jgi:hypothetical protein
VEELRRGLIFYDTHFYYKDAKHECDKLLLVLNKDHVIMQDVVIVPATTNKIDRPYNDGCNKEIRNFYFAKKIGFYSEKTIIQFDDAERIDAEEFERRIKAHEMKPMGYAQKLEIERIIACLKGVKEYMSDDLLELIF